MNRPLENRIRRLEQAAGDRDDELVEHEFSDRDKALLRDVLTGLWKPEEIEAIVNERRLVPRSSLPVLSPEGRAQLEQTLRDLDGDQGNSGQKHDCGMSRGRS
jgi:hypothetical protein